VLSAATRRGDRPANQDQALLLDGAVAVLDGATSWLAHDPSRDGGWYARSLGAALAVRLPGHGAALSDLLADAIAELRDRFALHPDTTPYSTASLVRWTDNMVETLVLGDSPVLVLRRGPEPELIFDDRLEPVGAEQRAAYRRHLRDGHGFSGSFASLVGELQRAEKEWRNREGGFWIAGAEPAAAGRAVQRSFSVDEVETVLVMSDGVTAGVLEYGIIEWRALAELACSSGPAAVIDRVHTAEESDADGRRWPRTKRHDDKTLVVATRDVENGRSTVASPL
jgi:hypothetical protein